jgi:hypothetical protein
MHRFLALVALVLFGGSLGADYPFVFRDVGDESALLPGLAGIRGHAAAWGDVDGDGWPDLFVGTFHDKTSKTSLFFRNKKGKFTLDEQPALRLSSCASGALFVDLTNSGKLDLYVSNSANGKEGARAAPCNLLKNDGTGKFTDVSKESSACPPGFLGRTVAAADFDGDGLLDLIVCDFYYSPKANAGIALYRNKGDHKFEDVAKASGLPTGTAWAGVAVADVNADGWPDIFLTSPTGDNRLYLNDGKGKFKEAANTRATFAWKVPSNSDPVTGVCIADVNRDGLPDIIVGHHYKQPWRGPAPVRLYLHKGIKDGNPTYEDVTSAAGLTPLGMKAPHLEIQDFDNDGWPDIFVSIVKFRDGKPYPVIYRNLGERGAVPKFRDDAWAVNDFPAAADLAPKGTAAFYDNMIKSQKILYCAAGPTADFDRDGRIDLLFVNWWPESHSLLLKNETKGGNWLDVLVEGKDGVNRMGIGAMVRVFEAGKLGDSAALLGAREICIGYGWCSGQEAAVHFGLGKAEAVDIEVTLPHGKGKITRKDVKANQRLTVKPG